MLVHAVIDIVRQHADPRDKYGSWRDLDDALHDLFFERGIEILTDYDRQEYGLPARGPDGWTMEEIIALEQKRLEVMRRPILPIVIELEPRKDRT